jgi:L-ascorbate metabolism protein UlaG (beta-lactamase superfamily)
MYTSDTTFTWLGHGTFRITTAQGKTILVDPWVMNNPACPAHEKMVATVDAMLCTHGHFDHIGDAVEIARSHDPLVVGIFELCHWLERKGVRRTSPMNKGGTQDVLGVQVTMVHADHSCGILDGDQIIYGGEAVGYVLRFADGLVVYHAGDTNVFGDMALIRELYAPELVMLPIGDLFTMAPREAAHACRLLQPRAVIPMHFGTFPPLTGTPAALRDALSGTDIRVVDLAPGQGVSARELRSA